MQKHIMLDMETMGVSHCPVICSIGAVVFDMETGKSLGTYYRRVDMQSCADSGMKFDASTIIFWMQQCKQGAASDEITSENRISICAALAGFRDWYQHNELSGCKIWSNGIHADLVWLKSAFDLCGIKAPWEFRDERDVRTLVDFGREIKESTPTFGEKHHALDDCLFQIEYVYKIYNKLVGNNGNQPS